MRRAARLLPTLLLLVAGPVACRETPAAFGGTPAEARENAADLFGGIADRFTNVVRTPKFEHGRGRLARHALSPSGVFGDTSVWTSAQGATRTLWIHGSLQGNRYVFDAKPRVPDPIRPGESRHLIQLVKLPEEDVYRWDTGVEMAVGEVRPRALQAAWGTLLASADRPEAVRRAAYRATLPRTTRTLGQLLSLDSITSTPLRDGSTLLTLVTTIHADRVRAAGYPAFAKYLDKYVKPASYSVVVTDSTGARWLAATARDYRLVFRLRAKDGRLAPLDGPPRTIPERLTLRGNFYAKFSVFRVGMENLTADVRIVDSARAVGWDLRFRQEPRWRFPLAVDHLIKSALRRPFAGDGMHFRLVVERPTEDRPSQIRRVTTVTVQEGAIVRWLGGLGGDAMGEFAGQAEREENAFTANVFRALASDMVDAVGVAAGLAGEGSP